MLNNDYNKTSKCYVMPQAVFHKIMLDISIIKCIRIYGTLNSRFDSTRERLPVETKFLKNDDVGTY